MAKEIVTQPVEIWVSRDFDVYTHKIYRDGSLQSAGVVSRTRAQEIVTAHPGGQVRGLDAVDFSPGAKQFTWIVQVEGDNDGN